MSLFDLTPITIEEVRLRQGMGEGPTIRKLSGGLKPVWRTIRHKPWWMFLGKGPDGATCRTCRFLTGHRITKTYFKCGRQVITRGPGTDIRAKDPACRLYEEGQH